MAHRLRPTAAALLVILLAHLALMASPLHASGRHGGAGHAGHTSGAVPAGPAHSGAGGDRFAPAPDRFIALAGVRGLESHVRAALTWPVNAERFEDCALTPGPAPKRWGLDLGVLRAAPLALLVVPAPAAGAPPTPAPPRPPPAAQLAFLQSFRN